MFNLYWLWQFGTLIITISGLRRWMLLFVSLAFVSSGFQLLLTGKTGFGASGIVYGYLGFLWTARSRSPEIQNVLPIRTLVYFLLWLAFCIAATALHVWEVANVEHIVGLGFGALFGAHVNSPRSWNAFALAEAVAIAIAALPLVGAIVPIAREHPPSMRVQHRLETSTKTTIQ
jgi:membrane associated rhomboid family serine protease